MTRMDKMMRYAIRIMTPSETEQMEAILEKQSELDVLRPPSDEFPPLRFERDDKPRVNRSSTPSPKARARMSSVRPLLP